MNRCLTRLGRLATQFNSSESKLLGLITSRTKLLNFSPSLSRKFSTSATPNFGAGTGGQDSDSERVRKVLPEELLSKNVVVLTCQSSAKGGVCNVYLVGTTHYSPKSCREVQNIISYLKPELVFLGLCQPGPEAGALTRQKIKVPTDEEILGEIKRGNFAVALLKAAMKQPADDLELLNSDDSEFLVACEEAMKYGGEVIFGDRPSEITFARLSGKMMLWHSIFKLPLSVISASAFCLKHITLQRTSGKMPIWQKIMPPSLFFRADCPSSLEYLVKLLKNQEDNDDMQALIWEEVKKRLPIFHETLVHERDMYMSSALLNFASKHRSVVAVVGRVHLQGIKKHWQQPVVVKDLLEIPSHDVYTTILKYLPSV